jgi:hypothetical protein
VVPVLLLTAGCAAVILAGNLLAVLPAAIAARTPAAGTLRTEYGPRAATRRTQ